jgi:hypothetical protein
MGRRFAAPDVVGDDKYRLWLLDLLAVIHRDGGHKTQGLGIKLSWEHAMQISSKRIAALSTDRIAEGLSPDAARLLETMLKSWETMGWSDHWDKLVAEIRQWIARHPGTDRIAEGWPFKRGDKFTKIKGHPFGAGDAEVVACYQTRAGEWRVVGEHPEGWQFIFAPGQIALASPVADIEGK